MLQRLGDMLVRRRWWVLGVTLIFVGVAGWLGGGVAQELTGGGFEDPNAESARAAAALEEVFETGDPNVVLLVTAADGDVDDPAVAEAGMALTSALSQIEGVTDVASYWALGSAPPLRSNDGSQALVLARMDEDDEAVADSVRDLVAVLQRGPGHRRDGWCLRGIPRDPGDGRERPGPGGVDRFPHHTWPARLGLREPGGGLTTSGSRRHRHHRHLPGALADQPGHRRLDLRPQPHDSPRSRSRDRLQPVRGLPLPRRARPTGCPRTMRSWRRCVPPGGRWHSAP